MYELPYLPFEVYQIYRIYEFYDEPLVYSFVDRKGNLYLANWADWDEETGLNTWLYLPISKVEIIKLEKQEYSQKELFDKYSDEIVYVANENEFDEKYYLSKVSELNKRWLPKEDSYIENMDLEESEDDEYELVEGEVVESNRYVVELSLDHGSHEKEIDSTVLGEFLIDYQKLINAVALDSDATTRSRIPTEVEDHNKLMVTDTFAASFGIKLESAHLANLLCDNEIVNSIKSVQKLLSLDDQDTADFDSVLINNFNEKAIDVYTELLSKINRYNTNLKSEAILPTGGMNVERNVAKMDSERSQNIINLINNKKIYESEVLTISGELYSVNYKTKKFQFQEDAKEKQESIIYKGDISDGLDITFEIPSRGVATINNHRTINPYKHTEKEEYVLTNWKQE